MTEQGPPSKGDPGSDPVGSTADLESDPAASTGDPRVDSALAALDGLDGTPVHDHAAVVEEVHRSLQDALADEED